MNFNNAKYYENRELSWLKFNERVLNESKDRRNAPFDRLKFISICSSNLDEFFMVRVAYLKDMVHAGYSKTDIAGLTAKQQLSAVGVTTRNLVKEQYRIYNKRLIPDLEEYGVTLLHSHEKLTPDQEAFVDKYFATEVYPVLTPMAHDASRPFPLIQNKSLNIAAFLKPKKKSKKQIKMFATVQVPAVLPRFVKIPSVKENTCFILLEQIIERNLSKLYSNYDVICAYPYRIMRNADYTLDEEDAEDLLLEIEKQIKKRQWGEPIRLEVEKNMDKDLLTELAKNLKVDNDDIYYINGPIDLTFTMKLAGLEGFEHLRALPYVPQPHKYIKSDTKIFDAIKKRDYFLSHPYESFDPVVNFIKQASEDEDVLAIKQTLYRVSGHSPIVAALAKAAENGKQVTVLVELKARFDEENNIEWARMLENAGCHVIYGLVGLKTHCKIALVVRKEKKGIVRYVHLGTGNYNDSTAKLYTDCGIFTCKEEFGEDATAVFNMLSGYNEPEKWHKLALAPFWLRDKFVSLIDREIAQAKAGKDAEIIAKMNSLCDQGIISKLYEASCAGVKITLIVRGICCIKVGIKGVSENITVKSIVGTFLEHSRIFYFKNGGEEEYYMASADWMPRNLDRRVEILFPVEEKTSKQKLAHMLDVLMSDNLKAYTMDKNGDYVRSPRTNVHLIGAQDTFMKEAMTSETKATKKKEPEKRFTPRTAIE